VAAAVDVAAIAAAAAGIETIKARGSPLALIVF